MVMEATRPPTVVGVKNRFILLDTVIDFKTWLKKSKQGDNPIVYFQGASVYNPVTNEPFPIAKAAYRAYEKGLVHLTQERFWPQPNGQFNYIATKR